MTRFRIATLLILSLVASLLVTVPAGADEHAPDDLLFTQYVEGSSFNKAIEVGNTTGDPIDLADGDYYFVGYHNGNTSPSYRIELEGTVDDGEAWVMADGQADASLQNAADVTRGGLWNGDDALVLYRDYNPDADTGTVLDSIGRVGEQEVWGSGDTTTENATLYPREGRVAGDTDPSDAYDPADDWVGFPVDTFDGIGDPTFLGPDGSEPTEPASCDEPTPIHEINEVGDDGLPTSDMFGDEVAVEGIVTADFTEGLDALFVQEAEFDEDAADSHGIMTWVPDLESGEVSVGDEVCATGEVDQFSGTVQLADVEFEVLATGQDLPDIVDLEMPVEDRTELAALAGTRVELTSTEGAMTITQNYFQGQFGELDLSATGRLWNPTELYDPHDELDLVEQEREDNLNSWIKLDDANSEQNLSPTPWLANGAERAGAQTDDPIVGVTHYQHGAFRIQPTSPDDITFTNEDNPRPDGPPDVLDGADSDAVTVTVAGFNVLNYFTTLGERGADTEEEFELQAAKIVEAITTMDADVVGLMEIENNFGADNDALEDLLERLNDEAGEGTYDAVGHDEPFGSDAISNALIFQPDEVTPAGDLAIADHDGFVDPLDTGSDRNRPAVTQAFEADTGDEFVVAVNHLKSKGSGCGEGDDDPWQGSCNGTRTAAAQELVRWLDEDDPTGTGSDEVVIIGDLNAYAQEDPVQVILDNGYEDTLGDQLGEVYTYVFDGEHGRLDHGLVSDALVEADHFVDADVWHINVDEPAAFDYNDWNNEEDQEENEFRSSDHDPVIVGLQFPEVEQVREAVFDDPRGRAMTGRTNVVPFTVVDGGSNPLDLDGVTAVLTTADGEEHEVRVAEHDEPGAFHAQFSTQVAGSTTLTVFAADGSELGSTTFEIEERPGAGRGGRGGSGGGPPGR